jgi:hypothetical protein
MVRDGFYRGIDRGLNTLKGEKSRRDLRVSQLIVCRAMATQTHPANTLNTRCTAGRMVVERCLIVTWQLYERRVYPRSPVTGRNRVRPPTQ